MLKITYLSVRQQKHRYEEPCDYPGAELDFLEISAEDADYNIRNQTECDSVRNVISKRHQRECQKSGYRDLEIIPIDVFDRHHH